MKDNVKNNWDSLVSDLRELIIKTVPTYIVLPHPQLDTHDDHAMSFVATIEALKTIDKVYLHDSFLLYTNHAKGSEVYPFGPASASSSDEQDISEQKN